MSQVVALYGTIKRPKHCTKDHQGMFLWSWSVTTGLQSCDFDTALGAVVEISGGETRKWKQNWSASPIRGTWLQKSCASIWFGLKISKGKLPNHQASTGWSWKNAKILMNFKSCMWQFVASQSDNFCTRYLNFGEFITSERRFQRVRGKLPIANPESFSYMSSTVEITWYKIYQHLGSSKFYHGFTMVLPQCSFILNSISLLSLGPAEIATAAVPLAELVLVPGVEVVVVDSAMVKSGPVWYGWQGKGDVGMWAPVSDPYLIFLRCLSMLIYFLPAYRAFKCL